MELGAGGVRRSLVKRAFPFFVNAHLIDDWKALPAPDSTQVYIDLVWHEQWHTLHSICFIACNWFLN